ncbi:MAG: DUF167 domain-containing protein [Holosporales bacterium]|jgi:uncharacterized protein (TIGR00251 family)|nr:DUF167 domain-containing protein [Holosporales bacterium]
MHFELNKAFVESNGGLEFYVYLTPGAKKEGITELVFEGGNQQFIFKGFENKRVLIKISIRAKPVENQANIALIKFVAERFATTKSNVLIKSGMKSRCKLVRIANFNISDIPENLMKDLKIKEISSIF